MQDGHHHMERDQVIERIWECVRERTRIEKQLKYCKCCNVHLRLKQDSFHFRKCSNEDHNHLHNKRIEAILTMRFDLACLRTYE